MLGRVELCLSDQCVEHSPVEIRLFLFDEEAVCSFGSTDFEDAVDLPVVTATFRSEVEIRDERESPQLLEKRLNGRLKLHCVHYYYTSITNGQCIIQDCFRSEFDLWAGGGRCISVSRKMKRTITILGLRARRTPVHAITSKK